MTPLDQLAHAIRSAIADGQITRAGIESLRQSAIHVLDHDESTGEEIRAALRWALNAEPQDASSFQTDSGLFGRSRAL